MGLEHNYHQNPHAKNIMQKNLHNDYLKIYCGFVYLPEGIFKETALPQHSRSHPKKSGSRAIYWIIMRTFTSPTTTGDYPLPDGVFKEQTNIMLCRFQIFFM